MTKETGVTNDLSSSSEVKNRGASIVTDLLVRAHLSDGFKERKIQPTTVVVEFYFQDPQPDSDRIQDAFKDRVLKQHRFCAVFQKEGNRVFWDSIPKEEIDMKYNFEFMDGKGTFGKENVESMISTLNLEEDWDASKPFLEDRSYHKHERWKVHVVMQD
eukprot:11162351-Ditylum_brightwellii.AAC.1